MNSNRHGTQVTSESDRSQRDKLAQHIAEARDGMAEQDGQRVVAQVKR